MRASRVKILQNEKQVSWDLKHNYFRRRVENSSIICLQEVHGKDEFLQATHVLVPRFKILGTSTIVNENAAGSAICIHKELLPVDAVVTHVFTCQGRDHIVNVRSGCRNLVVVNVHFELELTLRSLRERLRLMTPHGPHYSDVLV